MDPIIQELSSFSSQVGAFSGVVKQGATGNVAWFSCVDIALRRFQETTAAMGRAVESYDAPMQQAQADIQELNSKLQAVINRLSALEGKTGSSGHGLPSDDLREHKMIKPSQLTQKPWNFQKFRQCAKKTRDYVGHYQKKMPGQMTGVEAETQPVTMEIQRQKVQGVGLIEEHSTKLAALLDNLVKKTTAVSVHTALGGLGKLWVICCSFDPVTN